MKRRAIKEFNKPFKKPRLARQNAVVGNLANPKMGRVVMKAEKKNIDDTNSLSPGVAVDTFTAADLINGSVYGASAVQHVGRKITMTSINIRYSAALAPTTTQGTQMRLLVVYDKQSNAALPAITDILAADSFNALNNLNNSDRFVTLFNHLTEPISVGNNFAVAGVLSKKINLDVIFNAGTAGTVADIQTGAISIWAAQTGNAAVASPVLTFRSRIRFLDQ